MNKLTKLMKLKLFLWLVVYLYLFYAIFRDGPSAGICFLLAAAIIVSAMQAWLHSKTRARWRAEIEKKNKRNDD